MPWSPLRYVKRIFRDLAIRGYKEGDRLPYGILRIEITRATGLIRPQTILRFVRTLVELDHIEGKEILGTANGHPKDDKAEFIIRYTAPLETEEGKDHDKTITISKNNHL